MGRQIAEQEIVDKLSYRLLSWCLIGGSLATAGCDQYWPQPEMQQEVARELEEVKQALGELAEHPDAPVAEVKKLHQWEYQVFSVPLESGATDYERALNRNGQMRWDCFHIERVVRPRPSLMFFCKRPPETPLRYLPRAITGR